MFYAGDRLTVTKHSVGSGDDGYVLSDKGAGVASGPNTSSYIVPSATNDTFELRILVFETTGTYYTWSCQAGPNPPTTSQTITFTSSPSSPNVGATYIPQASGGGSGNSISFSIDGSTTNSACSISGSTVHFNNTGTCVIDANQAGGISNGTVYTAAPQAQQSVAVAAAKQNQTITFNAGPPRVSISSPPYDVDVSASSGLAVDITIDSSSTSICTANQGRVTFQAVGTCVIDANQAGNSTYNAAPQVQQQVTVSKDPQFITFSTSPPSPAIPGGTYSPSASSTSGLTVAFTIDPASATVCSISNGVVSFLAPGSCVLNADQAGNAQYAAASQARQTFTVGKLNQSISFTSTAPAAAVNGPTYTPSANATPSGLTVAFTIDAASASVCSISGGAVSFQASGSCVIDANQAGNANYNAASQVQQTVNVGKGTQTISFTSTAPAAVVSGPTYTPSANATPSGLTVAFTIDAGSTSVCSISGGAVSFQGSGSCVIDANQAGSANYNAASQVQQTVTVGKGTQTISFTSTAPAAVVSGPTYTPMAMASPSGLTVAFTIDASSTSVCSISGGAVSFLASGSCVIDANQAGSANYNVASQVQQTVTVGKGTQTISFTSTAPAATVSGPTYTPMASASPSGLTVAFTIDAASTSVCSIAGGAVSFLASGSCVIDANQAGSANYNAASQVQQTVTVGKGTQTISFTSTAPAATVSGPTYTPSATASPSGLTVAFTIDPSSASVCSISGGAVSFLASGSCIIDANQAGSANYNAASQVQQTVTVGKGTQTTAFTSSAPTTAVVSGATYTPMAAASPSGLTVALTIDPSSASICSISGGAVSFLASGSCVIDANQAGGANYAPASQVQQTVTVGKGTQTISFTSTAPAATVSGPTYTPSANASPSGLAVAFTIDPSSASICSISGGAVSFLASGSCVIDANQVGSANYTPASQVQQTVTVGKGTQTIAFTSTAPSAVVSGPTYTPTATASPSGLTVAFTIDAASTSICAISGGAVSFLASGSCVIDANQPGSANYTPAPQVQQTVTVSKGTQTIAFTSTAPAATASGPTYTSTATATPSGLTVAFTIDAASASVCAISGGAVSFLASGSCVIDANQAGSVNYTPAPQVQQTVTVGKGTQTIAFTSSAPAATASGATYTPTATATPSGLTVAFTIDAASTSICSISGGAVSFLASGSCVIDANQPGSANYTAAPQVQQTVTVGKGTQTIAFTSSAPAATASGATYTPTATASPSNLTVAFTIDAASAAVCSISGGTVSFQTSGSCIIDANQAGNANYLAAPQKQQSFAVNKASPAIVVQASSASIVFGASETFTATVSGGVTPTGTVTFKDGNKVLATVGLSSGQATYTTASLATGSHSITAIYGGDSENNTATSAAVSVKINVRPNPALNPDVSGLVTAQAATAMMFGRAQLTNTERRLEELHDEDNDDPVTSDQGQSPSPTAQIQTGQRDGSAGSPEQAAQNGPKLDGSPTPYGNLALGGDMLDSINRSGGISGNLGQPPGYAGTLDIFSPRRDPISQTGRAFEALSSILPAGVDALNKRFDLPFHIWFYGAVSFGNLDTDGSYSNRFNADGLTVGFDRKFFDGFIAGVAFGVGLEHTSVGTDGTALDASAYSGTVYASYRFMPHTFLDAIAGYGKISSTDSRWSSDANTLLSGARGGEDLYGSVSLTRELNAGPWKFAPYLRAEVVHIDLNAFGEAGSPVWDLTYNELSTTAVFAVAGTRLGYTIPESWGTLTPTLRLEYSRALTGSYNEYLSYTALPGTNYLLTGNAQTTDLLTVGVGVRAVSFDAFSVGLEYLYSAAPNSFNSHQFRADLKQAF